MSRPGESAASVSEALIEVVQAGQRLVADRVDLALVEARAVVEQSLVRLGLVVVGALLLAGALFAIDAAIVEWIARFTPRPVAFLSCAGFDALVGGGLVFAGIRRRGRP